MATQDYRVWGIAANWVGVFYLDECGLVSIEWCVGHVGSVWYSCVHVWAVGLVMVKPDVKLLCGGSVE